MPLLISKRNLTKHPNSYVFSQLIALLFSQFQPSGESGTLRRIFGPSLL